MESWFPKRPESLEEAKVRPHFVRDSVLKALLIQGVSRGYEFGELLKLPFALIEPEVRHLQENFLIVPVGGAGLGGAAGIDFGLTKECRQQAQEMREPAFHHRRRRAHAHLAEGRGFARVRENGDRTPAKAHGTEELAGRGLRLIPARLSSAS